MSTPDIRRPNAGLSPPVPHRTNNVPEPGSPLATAAEADEVGEPDLPPPGVGALRVAPHLAAVPPEGSTSAIEARIGDADGAPRRNRTRGRTAALRVPLPTQVAALVRKPQVREALESVLETQADIRDALSRFDGSWT